MKLYTSCLSANAHSAVMSILDQDVSRAFYAKPGTTGAERDKPTAPTGHLVGLR